MTNEKPKPKTESRNSSSMMLLLAVGIFILLPIGYVIGNQTSSDEDTANTHLHSDFATESEHAHGETQEVGEGVPAPEFEFTVTQDLKSGWNVHMEVSNFRFAPESVNSEHLDGDGHAHLWIDGVKITRLYSPDYYLGDLSEGEHEVMVTLNNNMHADYVVDSKIISQTVTVTDTHHAE